MIGNASERAKERTRNITTDSLSTEQGDIRPCLVTRNGDRPLRVAVLETPQGQKYMKIGEYHNARGLDRIYSRLDREGKGVRDCLYLPGSRVSRLNFLTVRVGQQGVYMPLDESAKVAVLRPRRNSPVPRRA